MRLDHPTRLILAASALALLSPKASADVLDQFTFGPSGTSILTPTTIANGISAGAISADAGVDLDLTNSQTPTPPSGPWLRVSPKAGNTNAAAAITANADFKFTLSALPGFTVNLSSLTFDVTKGGSGTRGYAVLSSADNFASTLGSADVATTRGSYTAATVNLGGTSFQNVSTLTFKIFSYSGATGSSVEYDNITLNGTSTFQGYTWQGGNGTWDTASANWTGAGTTYVDSTATSNALFDDTGTVTTVNVAAGGVTPNIVDFTNSTAKSYTLAGGSVNAGTVFKAGSGTTTINNAVTGANVTADAGTLAVGAGGTLTSANLTVSPTGTLTVASTGLLGASSGLTVNGALGLNNATQTVATLAGAGTGVVSLGGTALTVSGTSTYAGKITGTGSLIKSTGGTLTLSGASDYSGGTIINGGAIQLSSVTGAGTGGITVNSGGILSLGAAVANTITLAGGTLGASAAATAPANLIATGTSTIDTYNPITGTTANDVIISGMLQGNGTLNVQTLNGTNPDNQAFRLRGPISTGTNAFTGTISVPQSGKVELQTSVVSGSPMGTGKLVLAGGTNTGTTATGTFSIVNLRNNFTGNTTLGNNVEITGTGVSYFNLLGTASAGSTVAMGDLLIGDGQAVAAVANTNTAYNLAFSSVRLNGGNATFSPRPVGNTAYTTNNTISLGSITENVAGSGITLNGVSTLTLSGTSTYTGPTVVTSGTLSVNGSIAASAVALNGGTLRGGGTTGAVTMGNAVLAPGNSIGTLNTGALTINGGTLALEIGGAGAGSYDQVNVTGAVSLNAPVALTLDFSTYSPVAGTDKFTIINNDGADAVALGGTDGRLFFGTTRLDEGTVFTATSGSFTQSFMISYAGGTGNDVVLTAVPEPGTATALLAGVGMLTILHRRRR